MASRAVVDTNILVSALLKRGSIPDRVALAIRDGICLPVVCAEIVDEYTDVLRRPRFGFLERDVTEILDLFAAQARWVRITPYLPVLKLPDPADWPFIAAALAADCPVITGNVRHFPQRIGVQVMTAKQWVEHPR